MSWVATATALVGAAASGYSAISASRDKRRDRSALEAQREALAQQLEAAQGGLEGLYAEQSDPLELFKSVIMAMPELLDSILPSFRRQSITTAEEFTDSNLGLRRRTLQDIFPEYETIQDRRVALLDEMDPANLGQEEIKAITRKLSPLIPEGTLDPSTGAVAGGTTSPVSLYRNLISGMYQERRASYLDTSRSFLIDAENSAARQQERASSFLPTFLDLSFRSASQVAGQTLEQEQFQIGNQEAYLRALLGMGVPQLDTSSYNSAIASGVTGLGRGLATAGSTYASRNRKTELS